MRDAFIHLALLASVIGACTGQVLGTPPEGPAPGAGGSTRGNDHPGGAAASSAPATGQRLTDRQYLNVVADLFGVDASAEAQAMPLDPKLEGFRNAA